MKQLWKKVLVVFVAVFIASIVYNVYVQKKKLSRLEHIIKQHNSIKDLNQKYPTINKTPSSQSTVFAGDSIRIILK